MARSHYEVLGVARDAPAGEVRRAYLERARELHPDRYVDAGGAARAAVERSMQEVNEAWRVLGDAGRRRRYDAELDPVGTARARWTSPDARFTSRPDGTMPEELEPVEPALHVIRGLPWIALVVVLFAIFVFTAYAVTGDHPASTQPGVVDSRCVTVDAQTTVQAAPCGSPGARVVVTRVGVAEACPAATERFQPSTGSVAYCLEV